MPCTHELWERESSVVTEGYCPICLAAQNQNLRDDIEGMILQYGNYAKKIERLLLWIKRIDNINDDPAHFNKEIDDACADALAGKPMTGKINA